MTDQATLALLRALQQPQQTYSSVGTALGRPGVKADVAASIDGDVVEAHLPGKHDQDTHGSGTNGQGDLPQQRKGQLAASVASGVASRERIGLSAVDRVRFNDGREGIVRRQPSRSEIASAEAAVALDAPVAATVKYGDELYQELAPGMQAWQLSNRVASKLGTGKITDPAQALAEMKADSQALVDLIRGDAGKRAGVFDYLTGQSDRHMSNWLVAEDGTSFTLIDHDLAFMKTISPFAEHWAKQKFSKDETAAILERVRELRDRFTQLGMSSKYQQMLQRAEYLHEHGSFDPDAIIANKLSPEGKPI